MTTHNLRTSDAHGSESGSNTRQPFEINRIIPHRSYATTTQRYVIRILPAAMLFPHIKQLWR